MSKFNTADICLEERPEITSEIYKTSLREIFKLDGIELNKISQG